MEKISKLKNESLTEFANRLSSVYNKNIAKSSKKGKGQFFTPLPVANYMASLSNISDEEVSILDPGAGTGILSAALVEKLLNKKSVKKINLVCYETDKEVIPYLKKTLEEAKKVTNKKNIFKYSILNKDFIESNCDVLNESPKEQNFSKYDIVISNPPYFKLNLNNLEIKKFEDIISGQPNIYFLFMAISAKLLTARGEMIFITPRSFCSGLYYNKFRNWLLEKVNFSNIHLFESRKDLFSSEEVLQENIITKFTKNNVDKINISKTINGDFFNRQKITVSKTDVIYRSNGFIFFRIPSNEQELKVIRNLDKLPFNFYNLGIKISTGKVVAFRNKKFLRKAENKNTVPLLWMHNIKNGRSEWPIFKKDKAIAIINTKATRKLLLETGNYLVLKRFTTKEQKKRFETACIYKQDFEKYGYFALDNMINYIYHPEKKLKKNHINGIAKYLNHPIVDLYFRILNGHTQVNANEVYALPFPSLEQLEVIGKNFGENFNLNKILNTKISMAYA